MFKLELGLLKLTRLKALKASARSWILCFSVIWKYLDIARSVLKELKPRRMPRVPTVPGLLATKSEYASVFEKMLGMPFWSVVLVAGLLLEGPLAHRPRPQGRVADLGGVVQRLGHGVPQCLAPAYG